MRKREPWEGRKMNEEKRELIERLADEVLAGKWGNGWNRKQALDSIHGKGTADKVELLIHEKTALDGC